MKFQHFSHSMLMVIALCALCDSPMAAQGVPVVAPQSPVLGTSEPKQGADTSGLSEVQRLKVELLQAKIAIAQLRATLADREARIASIELTQEQEKLVREFRQTLKADPNAEFDWTALKFKVPGQQVTPKRQ